MRAFGRRVLAAVFGLLLLGPMGDAIVRMRRTANASSSV